MNTVNFVAFNHSDAKFVEDYELMFRVICARNNFKYKVTLQLCPESINILVDEFTGLLSNEMITNFRQNNPKAKIFVVVTEFITATLGSRTFNSFGGWASVGIDCCIKIALAKFRPDIVRATAIDFFRAIYLLPLSSIPLIILALKCLRKGNLLAQSELRRRAYMLLRYYGLQKYQSLFDGYVTVHPDQENQYSKHLQQLKYHGQIFPEFGETQLLTGFERNRERSFEITGTVTPYRRQVINSINKTLKLYGIRREFLPCKTRGFSDGENAEGISWFSLHPAQQKNWPYCSPLRIYRAVRNDRTIPFMTRAYNQHPIERLCYLYQGLPTIKWLSTEAGRIDILKNKLLAAIEEYDNFSQAANTKVLRTLAE